ncbi:MAG: class I SAM-dependent methyltransferase [Actinomycetota bacterium]|nr:class I SAM-dependent methyltransferase [Actinomycetota bacterium]
MPESPAPLAGPIDLRQVLVDIDVEVEAKRSSGELPEDLERALDVTFARFAPVDAVTGDFDTMVAKLEASTNIDTRAPTDSSRRGVAQMKAVVAKAIDWELRHVASQASGLAHATTRALRLLGERVDDLERHNPASTETSLVELGVKGRASLPAGDWATAVTTIMAGITGRVCHAECGEGDLVAALRSAALDIYGVDPDERLVIRASAKVADLRADSVRDHLRHLPPDSLQGLILSGYVDRTNAQSLGAVIDLARLSLAPGGVLVVISHQPEAWDNPDRAVLADLAAGRPLHPETWQLLLAQRGLTGATVHPGGVGYAVSARR